MVPTPGSSVKAGSGTVALGPVVALLKGELLSSLPHGDDVSSVQEAHPWSLHHGDVMSPCSAKLPGNGEALVMGLGFML